MVFVVKTFVHKGEYKDRRWFVVDATGKVLGRFASRIASIIRGKNKTMFSPHLDLGDHVIVINADKVRLTGRKAKNKSYYHHSGYPGGLKKESFEKLIREKPERIIYHAVWGMLPHNKLGRKMVKKLKIYRGADHPHTAQKPQLLEI